MPFNPDKHHRRSVRLKDYDYAQEGAYFVTICTFQREMILGENTHDGVMKVNPMGEIVIAEWLRTAHNRPYVELDGFVVMPNHVHGIVVITSQPSALANVGAQRAASLPNTSPNKVTLENRQPIATMPNGAPRPNTPPKGVTSNNVKSGSLGAIVRGFKSAVTKRINILRDTPGAPLWQRSFHDVVIKDEKMLNTLRHYVENNPGIWAEDRHNPRNPKYISQDQDG